LAFHPRELREAMRAIIDELVEREEAYFANHKQMFLDYHVTI
jgi:hypothetical protein